MNFYSVTTMSNFDTKNWVKVKKGAQSINFKANDNCLDLDDIQSYFPGCTNIAFRKNGEFYSLKTDRNRKIKLEPDIQEYEIFDGNSTSSTSTAGITFVILCLNHPNYNVFIN